MLRSKITQIEIQGLDKRLENMVSVGDAKAELWLQEMNEKVILRKLTF